MRTDMIIDLDVWQKSKIFVVNNKDIILNYGEDAHYGFVYRGGGNIAIAPDINEPFHLILERSEWLSDDLGVLELRLYEWLYGDIVKAITGK